MDRSRTKVGGFAVQLTPFVGREDEIRRVTELMTDPTCRLLTLVGPGGIGKTRLAIEVAQRFPDSVLVPLQSLTSPDFIVSALAHTLDFQLYPRRDPVQQLLDYLRDKDWLLILDNFEHLLDGSAFLSRLLEVAPNVRLLITTRERLNMVEEWVYEIGGLSYPLSGSVMDDQRHGAVELFAVRAQRMKPDFVLSDNNFQSVARICRLVQGMPLAIELASNWVRLLSCEAIANDMEHSLEILRTPLRNVEARHRSIRAAFEPTWTRLSDEERGAYMRLSIFRGGFTREAAAAIAGASIDMLSILLERSLLRVDENGRYDVHELLRQYGEEQLTASGQTEAAQEAHRDYFAGLAYKWVNELKTGQQLLALDVLKREAENIRKAFRRAIDTGTSQAIEPFSDLWFFYNIVGWFAEGLNEFEAAIEKLQGQKSLALGKLLSGYAFLHERFQKWEQVRTLAEKSLNILRNYDSAVATVRALLSFGAALAYLEPDVSLTRIYVEALELARKSDDPWAISIVLYQFAGTMLDQRPEEAKALLAEAHALCSKRGDVLGMTHVLDKLAYLAVKEGDLDVGLHLYQECLTQAQRVGYKRMISHTLSNLSAVSCDQGDTYRGKRFAEDALRVERDGGRLGVICLRTIMLANVVVTVGNYEEAKARLQEAHSLLAHAGIQEKLFFVAVATLFLGHTGAVLQTITAFSALAHHPQYDLLCDLFNNRDKTEFQTLSEQLRTQLPADSFAAAQQRGRHLSIEMVIEELAAAVEELLLQSPPAIPKPRSQPGKDGLSTRELDVLRMVAEGWTNQEIADRLFIGISTVKKHINHIYDKIDVTSRTQALARARQLGLLD